jgi:L-rhamnose mutarotase
MIRRAFTMRLKPGTFDEYRHHHDHIWPELVAEIERSGIASITTFRNGDNLFLVSEVRDEGAWQRLWTSEVHRKWAAVMEPLMHLTPDGMVDAGELQEIFHVETGAAAAATAGARPGARA